LPRYREAQALLRQLGRWHGEARLQALGAALLRRAGQADEAAAAAAAAERARAQALDAAPAELRDAFARRLQASLDAGGTLDGN